MMRFRVVVTLLATTVVATTTYAQRGTVQTPMPLAVALLDGIDDPNLVAELMLSEDQVKVLDARRQAVWDERYTTPPRKYAETVAVRNDETNALLKKTLTTDQYRRVVQLAGQAVLNDRRGFAAESNPNLDLTRVTATALNRYPELVPACKLTDEQKKELTTPVEGFGGLDRSITLMPEQTAAVKEFLGPVFTETWTRKFDERLSQRTPQPTRLSLLQAKDVRAELQLTDEQARAFAALHLKWRNLSNASVATLSPKESSERAGELAAESEKQLATLDDKQTARLKQLEWQTSLPGRHIDDVYRLVRVVRELSLSEDQVTKLKSIWEEYTREAGNVFERADSFAPTEKRINDLIAVRRNKAEAVLTPVQTQQLTDLLGKPFTGVTSPDGLGPAPGGSVERFRTVQFGRYSTELTQLAGNKSIQDELVMTTEQITKATELRDELAKKGRSPLASEVNAAALDKWTADRSAFIESGIRDLLSAKQAKRFREIMLQSRERPGVGITVTSAVAYPGVAEAVKLTDDQKKKLIAGTPVGEVLTVDQKTTLTGRLGEPFKGDFTIPRTAFPRASGTALPLTPRAAFLASPNPAVEKELGLTMDQAKRLELARDAYRAASRNNAPFGRPTENRETAERATGTARKNLEKAVAETLTAEQAIRADQLATQSAAAANLVTALTQPDRVKQLGLSTLQTAKLAALEADAIKLFELIVSANVDDRERKVAFRFRDAHDERVLAVLTELQRARWNEQLGKKWTEVRKRIPVGIGPFGAGAGANFSGFGGFSGGFGGFRGDPNP